MSTWNKINEWLTGAKSAMLVIGAIITMGWTGIQWAVTTINAHSSSISSNEWSEYMLADSLRVEIGIEMAANVLVRLDSITYELHQVAGNQAKINKRLVAVELALKPDTVPMNNLQREVLNLRQMIADADSARSKDAAARKRHEEATRKAILQLQPIQTGDRKP